MSLSCNLSEDYEVQVKRHNKKLNEYYVEGDHVDFKKLADNPILIKLMLFTGVSEVHIQYMKYKSFLDDLPNKTEARQLSDKIYSDRAFLTSLEILYSCIFQSKFELDDSADHTIKYHHDILDYMSRENRKAVVGFLETVAEFLGHEGVFYFQSFRMIPYFPKSEKQTWGPCLWMLRMFILYCQDMWVKNNFVTHMQSFLMTMMLILPCNICKYHVIHDIEKTNLSEMVAILLSHPLYKETMITTEMVLHNFVSTSTINTEEEYDTNKFFNMYGELFKSLVETIFNKSL